jgi:hypothetical protein
MNSELSYYKELCSLVDLKLMKTVDDDTVSDPKPRIKKHPKDLRKGHRIDPSGVDNEEGPVAAKPRKEYKLEKAKRPKEPKRDVPIPEEVDKDSKKERREMKEGKGKDFRSDHHRFDGKGKRMERNDRKPFDRRNAGRDRDGPKRFNKDKGSRFGPKRS